METNEAKDKYILAYNLTLKDKIDKSNKKVDDEMRSTSTVKRFNRKVHNRNDIISTFKNKLKAVEEI